MTSRKPLVLALSGGGGHAAAHAGVIVELAAHGVAPAGYAGGSGGARRPHDVIDLGRCGKVHSDA